MTILTVKRTIGTTVYAAIVGSVSGILTFVFFAGARTEKWDNTAETVKAITPLVYKHEGILSPIKTVRPPGATLSRHKYEELPTIISTEFVPEFAR